MIQERFRDSESYPYTIRRVPDEPKFEKSGREKRRERRQKQRKIKTPKY